MILLIKSGGAAALREWQESFARHLPEFEVRGWNDPQVAAADVRYTLVWEPEPGRLAGYPNLRLIIGAGAGFDHLLADDGLPPGVPLARLILPETQQGMAEYLAMSSLMLMRAMPQVVINQQQRHWQPIYPTRLAQNTRIGVMGLGALGLHAARYLAKLGFCVHGWSRSEKRLDDLRSFHGDQELAAFLGQSEIVICLLPQTAETSGILNYEKLRQLPRQAGLINVGRALHVVQEDLLQALDEGLLSAAVLDVFDAEPLQSGSPLWTHPRIIITPHCAATPSRDERACRVAHLIRACEVGAAIPDLYDASKGY